MKKYIGQDFLIGESGNALGLALCMMSAMISMAGILFMLQGQVQENVIVKDAAFHTEYLAEELLAQHKKQVEEVLAEQGRLELLNTAVKGTRYGMNYQLEDQRDGEKIIFNVITYSPLGDYDFHLAWCFTLNEEGDRLVFASMG